MAEATTDNPLHILIGTLSAANSLNHQFHPNNPQVASGEFNMNGGALQALMQAHIANLTSHKAILELLAQGLTEQGPVDPTVAASLEGMYQRTGEVLGSALSVQGYFSHPVVSHNQNGGPALPTEAQRNGHGSSSPSPVPPTVEFKPQSAEANGQLFTIAKRRKREDDNLPIFAATKNNKKTKLDDPSHSRPSPLPRQAEVEYEDISGEVRKRMIEAREKRLKEKAVQKEDKRKRESIDSASSVAGRERIVVSRPKKRLKSADIDILESASTSRAQSEVGEAGRGTRCGSVQRRPSGGSDGAQVTGTRKSTRLKKDGGTLSTDFR